MLLFESHKIDFMIGCYIFERDENLAYIQKLISILRALKEKPDFTQVFFFSAVLKLKQKNVDMSVPLD